jgi:hypothetical protein
MVYLNVHPGAATSLRRLRLVRAGRFGAPLVQLAYLFVEYAGFLVQLVHALAQKMASHVECVALLAEVIALHRQAVTLKAEDASQLIKFLAVIIIRGLLRHT